MDLQGRGTTDLQRFYNRKSTWKRKLQREFGYVEGLFQRIQLHQTVGMDALFQRGHRLKEVAVEGYRLMVDGGTLRVEERVHRDIVRALRSAELYSETLKGRCEYLNYPTRTFPLFTCEVQLPGDELEEGEVSATIAEAQLSNILD